jgi:flagellar biosynthetic protein FliR
LAQLNVDKFLIFTLVLTRTSGLVIAAPLFAAQVPVTVRAGLAFALALLVMPGQWLAAAPCPGGVPAYAVVLGGELVIGLVLGMGISILLGGMQMAGELMGRIGGLTLADVFDPATSTDVPLFSQLLGLLSTAVFLVIGGHRILLGGLLDTFRAIPPGGSLNALLGAAGAGPGNGLLMSLVEMLLVLTTQSFHLAIRAAAPVVTAVLLATLVLGLISRTLPQLNVMVVGFGLNTMVTFGVFFLSLGSALLVFQDQVAPTLQVLFQTLRVPLHGP